MSQHPSAQQGHPPTATIIPPSATKISNPNLTDNDDGDVLCPPQLQNIDSVSIQINTLSHNHNLNDTPPAHQQHQATQTHIENTPTTHQNHPIKSNQSVNHPCSFSQQPQNDVLYEWISKYGNCELNSESYLQNPILLRQYLYDSLSRSDYALSFQFNEEYLNQIVDLLIATYQHDNVTTTTSATATQSTNIPSTTTTTTTTILNNNTNTAQITNNPHIYNNSKPYIQQYDWTTLIFWAIYIILTLGFSLMYILKMYFSPYYAVLSGWILLAKAMAGMIYINFAIIFLPSCHGLISFVQSQQSLRRYIPINTIFKFHKVSGVVLTVAGLIHTFAHLAGSFRILQNIPCSLVGNAPYCGYSYAGFLFTSIPGVTGIILLVAFFAIGFTSRRSFRVKHFNTFFNTHHLFLVIVIAVCIHGTGKFVQTPHAWRYLLFSMVLYLIDRVYRWAVTSYYLNKNIHIYRIKVLDFYLPHESIQESVNNFENDMSQLNQQFEHDYSEFLKQNNIHDSNLANSDDIEITTAEFTNDSAHPSQQTQQGVGIESMPFVAGLNNTCRRLSALFISDQAPKTSDVASPTTSSKFARPHFYKHYNNPCQPFVSGLMESFIVMELRQTPFEQQTDAINNLKKYHFKAGQYAKLTIPEISHISHPLTIASSPHNDTIMFIIKVAGNWTQDLRMKVLNELYPPQTDAFTLPPFESESSNAVKKSVTMLNLGDNEQNFIVNDRNGSIIPTAVNPITHRFSDVDFIYLKSTHQASLPLSQPNSSVFPTTTNDENVSIISNHNFTSKWLYFPKSLSVQITNPLGAPTTSIQSLMKALHTNHNYTDSESNNNSHVAHDADSPDSINKNNSDVHHLIPVAGGIGITPFMSNLVYISQLFHTNNIFSIFSHKTPYQHFYKHNLKSQFPPSIANTENVDDHDLLHCGFQSRLLHYVNTLMQNTKQKVNMLKSIEMKLKEDALFNNTSMRKDHNYQLSQPDILNTRRSNSSISITDIISTYGSGVENSPPYPIVQNHHSHISEHANSIVNAEHAHIEGHGALISTPNVVSENTLIAFKLFQNHKDTITLLNPPSKFTPFSTHNDSNMLYSATTPQTLTIQEDCHSQDSNAVSHINQMYIYELLLSLIYPQQFNFESSSTEYYAHKYLPQLLTTKPTTTPRFEQNHATTVSQSSHYTITIDSGNMIDENSSKQSIFESQCHTNNDNRAINIRQSQNYRQSVDFIQYLSQTMRASQQFMDERNQRQLDNCETNHHQLFPTTTYPQKLGLSQANDDIYNILNNGTQCQSQHFIEYMHQSSNKSEEKHTPLHCRDIISQNTHWSNQHVFIYDASLTNYTLQNKPIAPSSHIISNNLNNLIHSITPSPIIVGPYCDFTTRCVINPLVTPHHGVPQQHYVSSSFSTDINSLAVADYESFRQECHELNGFGGVLPILCQQRFHKRQKLMGNAITGSPSGTNQLLSLQDFSFQSPTSLSTHNAQNTINKYYNINVKKQMKPPPIKYISTSTQTRNVINISVAETLPLLLPYLLPIEYHSILYEIDSTQSAGPISTTSQPSIYFYNVLPLPISFPFYRLFSYNDVFHNNIHSQRQFLYSLLSRTNNPQQSIDYSSTLHRFNSIVNNNNSIITHIDQRLEQKPSIDLVWGIRNIHQLIFITFIGNILTIASLLSIKYELILGNYRSIVNTFNTTGQFGPDNMTQDDHPDSDVGDEPNLNTLNIIYLNNKPYYINYHVLSRLLPSSLSWLSQYVIKFNVNIHICITDNNITSLAANPHDILSICYPNTISNNVPLLLGAMTKYNNTQQQQQCNETNINHKEIAHSLFLSQYFLKYYHVYTSFVSTVALTFPFLDPSSLLLLHGQWLMSQYTNNENNKKKRTYHFNYGGFYIHFGRPTPQLLQSVIDSAVLLANIGKQSKNSTHYLHTYCCCPPQLESVVKEISRDNHNTMYSIQQTTTISNSNQGSNTCTINCINESECF